MLEDDAEASLQKLPGHETIPAPAATVCPVEAPVKEYWVAVIDVPLPMLGETKGKMYVLKADQAAVLSGS